MSRYQVETEDGSVYEVETEDHSTAQPTSLQRTESEIAGRQSLIPAARNQTAADLSSFTRPQDAVNDFINPLGALSKFGLNTATKVGAAQEAIESAQANPLLAIQRGEPGQAIPDLIRGLKGERVAQRGDLVRAALPDTTPDIVREPLAGAVGILTSPETAIPALMAAGKARQVAQAGVNAAKTGLQETGEAFQYHGPFKQQVPQTVDELLNLSEKEAAQLPSLQRQQYLTAQAQATSQQLAEKRLAFTQQAQQVQEQINAQRLAANQSLPGTAAKDLGKLSEVHPQTLSTPFRNLLKAQSENYRNGVNEVIANAESASGSPITFTQNELNQGIANKYYQPVRAGTPAISMEDPTEYRALTNLLGEYGVPNKEEISARELLNIADSVYRRVGNAAKSDSRGMTPGEVASQHLRDILLDMLEQKGIDVSGPKSEWRQWVPVRNLGFKLQSESGPGKLIGIVKGRNPVAAKHLDNLEALLGQSLDGETKQVFNQLDALKQQEVVEGAKKLELQRLLQQESGLAKESALNRKLSVEQRAEHLKRIRMLVYGIAGSAIGGATGAGGYLLKLLGRYATPGNG